MSKDRNIPPATRQARVGGPSFSLRNRIFRAVWIVAWALLAAWTPPPLHAWRRLVLRAFGAKVGRGARIYGSVRVWYPPNLVLGNDALIGWQVNLYNQGMVTIDAHAVVSQFSHIVTGTHDIDDPLFQLQGRPIHIGKYAWVASDAFVGPGVSIGEGAVLGARGVAFRDLQPWTVYRGNPAVEIKKRRPFSLP